MSISTRQLHKYQQFLQIFAFLVVLIFASIPANTTPINERRSPLEVGLISFDRPNVFLARHMGKTKTKLPLDHPTVAWVPGYVRNHAYIPAHKEIVLFASAKKNDRELHEELDFQGHKDFETVGYGAGHGLIGNGFFLPFTNRESFG
ncbi:hypothetical protein PPYR_06868 [Photinus pyralis]|uniref:Uncharacterized protein n=1 Tax=Photinus pyralis TaxID=7054 RepID=A0A1Y1K3T2_PHOPY|nr:hypothetical protein PPYR_06868 [Photinus pyralis]